MNKLLTLILIVAIIYYTFKLIGRVLLPWFIKYQVNKMSHRQSNAQQRTKKEYKKKEGEVTIQYQPEEKKDNNKTKGGDYVDYEEIKE